MYVFHQNGKFIECLLLNTGSTKRQKRGCQARTGFTGIVRQQSTSRLVEQTELRRSRSPGCPDAAPLILRRRVRVISGSQFSPTLLSYINTSFLKRNRSRYGSQVLTDIIHQLRLFVYCIEQVTLRIRLGPDKCH